MVPWSRFAFATRRARGEAAGPRRRVERKQSTEGRRLWRWRAREREGRALRTRCAGLGDARQGPGAAANARKRTRLGVAAFVRLAQREGRASWPPGAARGALGLEGKARSGARPGRAAFARRAEWEREARRTEREALRPRGAGQRDAAWVAAVARGLAQAALARRGAAARGRRSARRGRVVFFPRELFVGQRGANRLRAEELVWARAGAGSEQYQTCGKRVVWREVRGRSRSFRPAARTANLRAARLCRRRLRRGSLSLRHRRSCHRSS